MGETRKLYHRRIKTIRKSSSKITGLLKISNSELWNPANPTHINLIYTIAKNNVVLVKDTLKIALRIFNNNERQFRSAYQGILENCQDQTFSIHRIDNANVLFH